MAFATLPMSAAKSCSDTDSNNFSPFELLCETLCETFHIFALTLLPRALWLTHVLCSGSLLPAFVPA